MDERTCAQFAEAHQMAREQLAAAWQLHIDRIQQAVAAEWPQNVERIFEERMAALAAALGREIEDAKSRGQRDLSERLNQSVRRFHHVEGGAQWTNVLLDATQGFCDRAAVFLIEGQALRLQALANTSGVPAPDLVPLKSAPAFDSAVESKDTVVAMRTQSEMSEPIASLLGEAEGRRFYLFPVSKRGRVAAVLYADGDGAVDTAALELLATVAGAALESQLPESDTTLVQIDKAAPKQPGSPWLVLSQEDQDLHLRAQRSARVHVAEIRLYKSQQVKDGRARRALYTSLKEDIDKAREAFQRDYLTASDTMVDYLHLELIRTLANDNAALLGPEYPGPLDESHV